MRAVRTAQRPSGRGINRRDLIRYGASTAAAAAIVPALPAATAAAHTKEPPPVLPAPRPIPGGVKLPNGPLIHVFAPGPAGITLPFTGVQLQGLDVEPSVMTHYRGFTAAAFHVGTATGSDGRRYDLETDIRALKGRYVAQDGAVHYGTFGFI